MLKISPVPPKACCSLARSFVRLRSLKPRGNLVQIRREAMSTTGMVYIWPLLSAFGVSQSTERRLVRDLSITCLLPSSKRQSELSCRSSLRFSITRVLSGPERSLQVLWRALKLHVKLRGAGARCFLLLAVYFCRAGRQDVGPVMHFKATERRLAFHLHSKRYRTSA